MSDSLTERLNQVLEAIAEVTRDVGATTMIVSHNSDIAGMADRVIRFRNGRITEVFRNRERLAPRDMSW